MLLTPDRSLFAVEELALLDAAHRVWDTLHARGAEAIFAADANGLQLPEDGSGVQSDFEVAIRVGIPSMAPLLLGHARLFTRATREHSPTDINKVLMVRWSPARVIQEPTLFTKELDPELLKMLALRGGALEPDNPAALFVLTAAAPRMFQRALCARLCPILAGSPYAEHLGVLSRDREAMRSVEFAEDLDGSRQKVHWQLLCGGWDLLLEEMIAERGDSAVHSPWWDWHGGARRDASGPHEACICAVFDGRKVQLFHERLRIANTVHWLLLCALQHPALARMLTRTLAGLAWLNKLLMHTRKHLRGEAGSPRVPLALVEGLFTGSMHPLVTLAGLADQSHMSSVSVASSKVAQCVMVLLARYTSGKTASWGMF